MPPIPSTGSLDLLRDAMSRDHCLVGGRRDRSVPMRTWFCGSRSVRWCLAGRPGNTALVDKVVNGHATLADLRLRRGAARLPVFLHSRFDVVGTIPEASRRSRALLPLVANS